MINPDRLEPFALTASLRDNGLYSAILALPDLELEALAKALVDALVVARGAVMMRRDAMVVMREVAK